MPPMFLIFRWSWILGLALILPLALPAGGAQLNNVEIQRRSRFSPLIAEKDLLLRVSPSSKADISKVIYSGTPINILRSWTNNDGQTWLQVEISCLDIFLKSNEARRGWLYI